MLTQSTIQHIKSATLSTVVAHFTTIKKHGANWQGLCPFHAEKTPSFVVSDAKDIYKCFGCGRSGDAIQFVIEHEHKTFIEACEIIAAICNIPLEYQAVELSEKQKEALSAADAQEQVLNYVVPIYQAALHQLPPTHAAKQWLQKRMLDEDALARFNIGWAGEEWQGITTQLINNGWYTPAEKLGIIRRSKDGESTYHGYRNRITFPITDKNGRFIGLGGRFIETEISNPTAEQV